MCVHKCVYVCVVCVCVCVHKCVSVCVMCVHKCVCVLCVCVCVCMFVYETIWEDNSMCNYSKWCIHNYCILHPPPSGSVSSFHQPGAPLGGSSRPPPPTESPVPLSLSLLLSLPLSLAHPPLLGQGADQFGGSGGSSWRTIEDHSRPP